MENASKALLIAGGVFLTMLIIALVLFAWNSFSDFYKKDDELKDIENIAKFNEQFTNYNRDNVYGYELISLANKVADYNMRFSNAEDAQNDKKYNPITLNIIFPDMDRVKNELWYRLDKGGYIIKVGSSTITQSQSKSQIENIIKDALNIEEIYGSSDVASKLSKIINTLIVTDDKIASYANTNTDGNTALARQRLEIIALDAFNANVSNDNQASSYQNMINKLEVTRQYL